MSGPVTPEQLRLALERRFRSATTRTAGAGYWLLTAYPAEAAEEAMSILGPVLEERDTEIARLAARVSALEALAREILDGYRPYPREHDRDYYRPLPSSAAQVAEWRAVLEGESGSEESECSAGPGEGSATSPYSPAADHRHCGERTSRELSDTEIEAVATNWDDRNEAHIQVVAEERNSRSDREDGDGGL